MARQKKEPVKAEGAERKKVFSFLMLGFPTFLIVLLGVLVVNNWTWVIQIFISFYQFVLLKQFLDNYYEVVY